MFIATVRRKGLIDMESAEKGSRKSSQKIIELMRNDPKITVANLALHIGITERAIMKQIGKSKAQGRIRRIGPDKGSSWRVED